MDIEISPEPSPQEREAISEAIARLLAAGDTAANALYASPWRLAGLRENADDRLDS